MLVEAAIALIAGAFIGSFLTVVAHRVPRGEGIVMGRSRCPQCGEDIAAYDNVPVVSWLVLRGRCRRCGTPISATYPLTEAGLGALWAGTVLALGTDDAGELTLGLVLCAVLVAITLTDLERRIIPNAIVGAGGLAGIAIVLGFDLGDLGQRAIAVAAAGGAMALIALAYPRGMGMGDVKLALLLGAGLGRYVMVGLMIGMLAALLPAVVLLARHGTKARKMAIPFGPFLAFGAIVAFFFGEQLLDAYLGVFFQR